MKGNSMGNPINKSKKPQTFVSQQPKITSAPQQVQNNPFSRPTTTSTATASPSQQDIAKRAFEIYMSKGCPQGQDEQIWLEAERELRGKKTPVSSSR